MANVPNSLRLLLDTPLEEELYEHWLFLLETVLLNYAPPPSHLLICMTMMVHPDFSNEQSLRSSCIRILSKTLEVHGPRSFRHVLNFDPEQLGRHKRKKVRHAVDDSNVQAAEEVSEILLAGSQSICVKFADVWELFGCTYAKSGSDSTAWLQLTEFLIGLLQKDWNSTVDMGKDITKTILIQLLRVKDDKRVELKRILRNILTSPCEDYTIPDSYDRHEGYPHVTGSEQSTFNADTFATSICQKRQLINLIHAVTQVPRLNVIPKEEFISTLANILAPLSLWTTLDLMSYGSSKKSTMSTSLLLALCNGLLFRLAAYPERSSKGADRLVDWPKVQGWCLATSRSRDAIEATKVEFFKCTILWSFLGQAEHNVPQEAIVNATQSLSRGLDSVEKSVEDDPPNYPENREMGKQLLPTNEELRRDISLLKLHLQGSHHILQGSAMRVRR